MKELNTTRAKKIYCIIPAYNEAPHIYNLIHRVRKFVDKVVVVDDASTDKTSVLANSAGAKILAHTLNLDQGAALRTGNIYALSHGAEIVVHFDADGQFLAEQIPRLLKPLLNNDADIVFGSRFLGEDSDMPKFKRYAIMPMARLVNRIFFGIKLSDPQSGFRAMNRKALEKINIEQDGKAHCSEIIHKAFKNNLRVKEVPVKVIYHEFGQNVFSGFNIVKDFIIHKLIK